MQSHERIGRGGVVVLAIGLLCLAFFVVAYQRAFPVASIDLAYDRTAAIDRAHEFLAARGHDISTFDESMIFGSNGDAAVFLQKVLDGQLEEQNRQLAEHPVWRWQGRWFRSLETEEFRVHVAPDGSITRYEHVVPEAAEGADLDIDDARPLAAGFLSEVIGVDPSALEEVEASSKRLDARIDHTFEWQVGGYELAWSDEAESGVGSLRHQVRMQGDQVGSYEYYYKVPEVFTRELAAVQSHGALLAMASFGLLMVTGIAAFVVFVNGMRRGVVRWRLGLTFGLISLLAFVLQAVNSMPLAVSTYRTEMPYHVYIGLAIGIQVIIGLIFASIILACGAAGEATTRELVPSAVRTLSPGGLRGLGRSTVYGYGFAFIFLAYVTAFYIIGRRYFGVWVPSDGPYSQILSTAVPFLAPLVVSLWASVSEEAAFRLFAVPFLKKVTRVWWLAILIPSVIWAFAHSTYAVYPVWVRGVELTIAGIAFAVLFLKVDIMAAIIAHYVVDAIFISSPLLTSGNPGYRFSGVAVILLALAPAVVALVAMRRRGAEPPPA